MRRLFLYSAYSALSIVFLFVIMVLLLIAKDRYDRSNSRREGDRIVNWIEDYKMKEGKLPDKIGTMSLRYSWGYWEVRNGYKVRCYFETYARVSWTYDSVTSTWYLDQDN